MQIKGKGHLPFAVSAEGGLELIMEGCPQDCKSLCEEDAIEAKKQISVTTLHILMPTFLERERPCSLFSTMRYGCDSL